MKGAKLLMVNEIFHSIQGESSKAGMPCVFVRLTYCNLRCSYCDTEYAFQEGIEMPEEDILNEVSKYSCRLVEITGGEPLFQQGTYSLLTKLCDSGYEVLLETSGSMPIKDVDKRVKIIMDLKCPSSNMINKNLYENIEYLKSIDEIKFVIGNKEDYDWAKSIIEKFNLTDRFEVLISPVFGRIEPPTLSEWVLRDKLNARFQLQLHKHIWNPEMRGV